MRATTAYAHGGARRASLSTVAGFASSAAGDSASGRIQAGAIIIYTIMDTQKPPVPKTAFIVRPATPPVTYKFTGHRRSGLSTSPGDPAVVSVGGVEWTSSIPRSSDECSHINAWAESLVSQFCKTLGDSDKLDVESELRDISDRASRLVEAVSAHKAIHFPPRSFVRVHRVGVGVVVNDPACPLHRLPVLVESGNVWFYDLSKCTPCRATDASYSMRKIWLQRNGYRLLPMTRRFANRHKFTKPS